MNLGMNPWILWLIKGVGGVVLRDSMLVLMKKRIMGEKVHEEW